MPHGILAGVRGLTGQGELLGGEGAAAGVRRERPDGVEGSGGHCRRRLSEHVALGMSLDGYQMLCSWGMCSGQMDRNGGTRRGSVTSCSRPFWEDDGDVVFMAGPGGETDRCAQVRVDYQCHPSIARLRFRPRSAELPVSPDTPESNTIIG